MNDQQLLYKLIYDPPVFINNLAWMPWAPYISFETDAFVVLSFTS